MTIYRGYVGTYTKGESKGIYTFTLDTATATLHEASLVAQIEDPTYLCITKDEQTLYAVAKQNQMGGIASFAIQKETGQLTSKELQATEGSSPCYVSVNQANNQVLAAYYHRGTAEIYPVLENKLQPVSSLIQFEGNGPNQARQEKPHAHYANFTPDQTYAVIVDLGTDKITTYRMHNNQFEEANTLTLKPGSGPRHLTFHPNGKFAYVMTELSNEIVALTYHSEDGSFTELQYLSTIPADFTENSQGSAIHVSRDGKFVYVGNRGHNSIATFSIDEKTGLLTFISYTSTEGHWPRDFALDPSETFLIASNQESHNLLLFARHPETGQLTKLNSEISVPYPVCIQFLKEE